MRRGGEKSCLKTGGKCAREGGGTNGANTEEREVIQSRGKAGRQGHRARKTLREASSDCERSTRVRTESGREEEGGSSTDGWDYRTSLTQDEKRRNAGAS